MPPPPPHVDLGHVDHVDAPHVDHVDVHVDVPPPHVDLPPAHADGPPHVDGIPHADGLPHLDGLPHADGLPHLDGLPHADAPVPHADLGNVPDPGAVANALAWQLQMMTAAAMNAAATMSAIVRQFSELSNEIIRNMGMAASQADAARARSEAAARQIAEASKASQTALDRIRDALRGRIKSIRDGL